MIFKSDQDNFLYFMWANFWEIYLTLSITLKIILIISCDIINNSIKEREQPTQLFNDFFAICLK